MATQARLGLRGNSGTDGGTFPIFLSERNGERPVPGLVPD